VQAASHAELKALIFTIIGSHTKFSYVLHIPYSSFIPTPIHLPSGVLCFYLNLFKIKIVSNPALSAMFLGITSRALAKLLITNYVFPKVSLAFYLKKEDNSISIAPPPATIFLAFMHLLTIIIESFKDLSASYINYSAPPLNMIVADSDFGQSLKILYLSAPICISSNFAHVPKDSFLKLLTVV